jgi:transcriptional regulator with XRE-family HTH domain
MMHCDNCKSGVTKKQKGLYHYTESGLPNFYLKKIKWWQCSKCKARRVEIPKLGQLHRCIAWRLVTKPSMLTGLEIIFLRKALNRSQKEMAQLLGLSQVVLNRWETGARPNHGKANDSKIRFVYLTLQRDEYTEKLNNAIWEQLHLLFGKILKKAVSVKISLDPDVCSANEVEAVKIEHLVNKQISQASQ